MTDSKPLIFSIVSNSETMSHLFVYIMYMYDVQIAEMARSWAVSTRTLPVLYK